VAIHLFCFTTYTLAEAEEIIERMSSEHDEVFAEKFLAAKPSEADILEREVAQEYGVQARSVFLIRLNDKTSAHRLSEVSNLVKQTFGEGNVVVLLEGERPV